MVGCTESYYEERICENARQENDIMLAAVKNLIQHFKNDQVPALVENNYGYRDIKYALAKGLLYEDKIIVQIPLVKERLEDEECASSFVSRSQRSYLYTTFNHMGQMEDIKLIVENPTLDYHRKHCSHFWYSDFTGKKIFYDVNNIKIGESLYQSGKIASTRAMPDSIYVLPDVEIWGVDISQSRPYTGKCVFCEKPLTYYEAIQGMTCLDCFYGLEDIMPGANVFSTSTGGWNNIIGMLPQQGVPEESERGFCVFHVLANVMNFYSHTLSNEAGDLLVRFVTCTNRNLDSYMAMVRSQGGLYEENIVDVLNFYETEGDWGTHGDIDNYKEVEQHLVMNEPVMGFFSPLDTARNRHAVMIIGYNDVHEFRYFDASTGNYNTLPSNMFDGFMYIRRRE